jgi:transposase
VASPGLVAVVSARPTSGDGHPSASKEKAITSMPVDSSEVTITIGVDTHKDVHVAVAIDALGRRLDELAVPATLAGYQQLHCWAGKLGQVAVFGVEGTGSYGAGLARCLRRRGAKVVEVNRPDRATRHRIGKSDPIDAEVAARAVWGAPLPDRPSTATTGSR